MKLPESVKEIITDNINSAFVPMLLAAPEMLEALKLALDDLTGDYQDDDIDRVATIETILNAINVAEGRS